MGAHITRGMGAHITRGMGAHITRGMCVGMRWLENIAVWFVV